jgi:hypothetical protein
MARLLLFASTTGYQIREFDAAARRLGVELTLATDRCHVMEDPWGDRAVAVKFDGGAESLEALRGIAVDGVAAVGDVPAILAAEAAAMLGVPFHPASAVRACHDKFAARELYRAAGMRVPGFFRASLGEEAAAAARAPYPCVLKPVGLSGSRGVIRANDVEDFVAAFARIRAMLSARDFVQVEDYIYGREFAVEGLMTRGELEVLAIFDKPDPLVGPYFEETIYVTPSRAPAGIQRDLVETTAAAVNALGLWHGPVHAELRWNQAGTWILEVAGRPIGGLCSRVLGLEETVIRHAMGWDRRVSGWDGSQASGVMMIPIPRGGIYRGVEGVERAEGEVIITAKDGQKLIPLPEGSSYLGFIFARGESSEEVEGVLRRSHAELRFDIATALETFKP